MKPRSFASSLLRSHLDSENLHLTLHPATSRGYASSVIRLIALCFWLLSACAGRPSPAPTVTPVPPSPTPAGPRQPAAVSPIGMNAALLSGTNGQRWWNDTTFYEIFVRSFQDSDGDGIGDLNGLIQKLDYLNDGNPATETDLGITGIWLMPVMASPSYHGYDITDYYRVNPQYGTNEDFKRLMAEAHKRGIRVIIDLVLNHTSSQHPWFVEAQNPTSLKRDWYLWANESLGDGWRKAASGEYYYGYFDQGMPDLNYKNPAVTAEMNKVIAFWLQEMGVDGYRLDAIKYLIEDEKQIEHSPATHTWLREFRKFYQGINPQAYTVGEVWDDSLIASKYVGDQLDAVFEFGTGNAIVQSALNGQKDRVEAAEKRATSYYPPNQFAAFLTNHDQVRVRSVLINDAQAKSAASLLFAFAGTPFLYYGEEIGMRGAKPDENIRRPMQWTASGGFTTGTPWNAYADDFPERNVEAQAADPNSLLNHYRAWIRLRNSHEALRIGNWQLVATDQRAVYASLRSTKQECILTIVNLGPQPVTAYSLTLESGPLVRNRGYALLMGEPGALSAPEISDTGGFASYQPVSVLPPRGTVVIQFLP